MLFREIITLYRSQHIKEIFVEHALRAQNEYILELHFWSLGF
jgi:hypothetical protein